MMAAKYKELELLAGVLQLREQQIEDFRRCCEGQQAEMQRLKRPQRRPVAAPPPPAASTFLLEQPQQRWQMTRSASATKLVPSVDRAPFSDSGVQCGSKAAEEYNSLHGEVKWLRLRMTELEAAIGQQHERSSGLAQALAAKSKHVKVLEERVRNIHSPNGTWADSELDSAAGATEASTPSASVAQEAVLQNGPTGRDDRSGGDSTGARRKLPLEGLPQSNASQSEATWQRLNGAPSRDSSCAHSTSTGGCTYPHERPEREERSASSGHITSSRAGPAPLQDCAAPEGGATGSSSSTSPNSSPELQEVLREMRQLRLQMGELERATMERRGSGSSTGSAAEVTRRLTPSASHDRLLGSTGSSVRRTPTSVLSAAPPPSSGNGAGGRSWPWPRHSSERNLHSSRALGASSSRALRPGSIEASDSVTEWEYKPHMSGDPVDAAVAALVNRPGKCFKSWRALLCRLEHGVYLCGTHRIRIRISTSTSRLEASEDNGETWSDLQETLKVTVAMQRSLLERVREAAAARTAR